MSSMPHRALVCALAALLAVGSSAAQTSQPAPKSALSVAALRLGVVDLKKSIDFYVNHLAFSMAQDHTDNGYCVLASGETLLVLTRSDAPARIEADACHIRFNFFVDDLDATMKRLASAGVEFVGDELKSAVGRYRRFRDPSGHEHNLKQLFKSDTPAPLPRFYDIGISVMEMPKARAFYETVLEFEPLSEKFYPPVVPYKQRGCAFFILSDGKTKPAASADSEAWCGFTMQTKDLIASMRKIKAAGGVFLTDKPQRTGHVHHIRFRDPSGNVLELIQYVNDAPAAMFARFKELSGEWRGKSTKGWTERVTYQTIAAESCAMEMSYGAHPNEWMATMFHMDGSNLMLTHYCVAKNQPRLKATEFADDLSSVTFTFVDGGNLPTRDKGHMDKAVFSFDSPDKMRSRWTWYQDGKESWMEEIMNERTTAGGDPAPATGAGGASAKPCHDAP